MLDKARVMLVSVPEAEVADRFPLWRAALMRPIPVGGGVPAVFLDAVRSLRRWRESLNGAGSDSVADAVVDLIGAVICFAVPNDSGCVQRSLRQRERVKRFAQQNLHNPELNVELIAAGVDLSPRQVHRLFAGESLSLMRWIWSQRLEQCYRELTGDRAGQRSADLRLPPARRWGLRVRPRRRTGLFPPPQGPPCAGRAPRMHASSGSPPRPSMSGWGCSTATSTISNRTGAGPTTSAWRASTWT